MKKNTFIFALLCIVSFSSFSQKKTIYISTKLPITYRVYLDNQLQYFGDVVRIKLSNVPNGEKKMHIRVMTPGDQKPEILIAKNTDKEEYYNIVQEGDRYVLQPNPNGTKDDKATYTRGSYMPIPRPAVKDTSGQTFHSCKMTDSAISKSILDLGSLKEMKAKKNFVLNSMQRKCLYTHQIKSLGYRIDDDKLKLEIYQALFQTSLDRNKFPDLTNSFQSQLHADKFMYWFNQQKL